MKTKVLVLGGASVHVKLVDAAHALGFYVIVADYLSVSDSPAKRIADESWDVSIRDIDMLEALARSANVRAVLSTHLDPGQRPYQQLCERLGLPCYGTKTAFLKMTDKQAFKSLCRENGVDVIPEFSQKAVEEGEIEYPVFIKPSDSRGSRGQAVCRTREKALSAIVSAKKESSNGACLIEKYMEGLPEVQVTYFVVNGEPHLIRIADSYKGTTPGMEKVVLCAISPSKYAQEWIEKGEPKTIKMIKALNIRNGPFFMQGFYDCGKFRFFDPGLRFPGVDYELIYKRVYGIDLAIAMWELALTGTFSEIRLPERSWDLRGKVSAILFPTMKAGRIAAFSGKDILSLRSDVVAHSFRHIEGEDVGWTFNVNQRFAEIDMICNSRVEMQKTLADIQETVMPFDNKGASLALERFEMEGDANA